MIYINRFLNLYLYKKWYFVISSYLDNLFGHYMIDSCLVDNLSWHPWAESCISWLLGRHVYLPIPSLAAWQLNDSLPLYTHNCRHHSYPLPSPCVRHPLFSTPNDNMTLPLFSPFCIVRILYSAKNQLIALGFYKLSFFLAATTHSLSFKTFLKAKLFYN